MANVYSVFAFSDDSREEGDVEGMEFVPSLCNIFIGLHESVRLKG